MRYFQKKRFNAIVLVCYGYLNKIPQCGLNNWNLFPHSSGGYKFKIKALAGLVSPETFLHGLQKATFSRYPHMAFSLCAPISGVSSFTYKDTSPIGLEPYPYNLV